MTSTLVQTLSIGSIAHFVCLVNGYPQPSIMWTHNNVTLNSVNEILTVTNITSADAGVYQCIASNNVGQATVDFLLNVPAITRSPSFIIPDNRIDIEERQLLNIQCVADGIPSPVIYWLYNGANVTNTANITTTQLSNGISVLIIIETSIADSGNYTCVAVNNVGTASYTHLVTVTPILSESNI